MKIEEACKEKGTLPEFPNMYCLIVYLAENKLSPCWYDAETDHFLRHVSGEEALRTDWQPYPEVKEIRPEKAGELWQYSGNALYMAKYYHTKLDDEEIKVVGDNGICGQIEGMVHNKNGWKRLFPKPEDESVETIEIEKVDWYQSENLDGVVIPDARFPGKGKYWQDLLNKPPMKMILEIPKV